MENKISINFGQDFKPQAIGSDLPEPSLLSASIMDIPYTDVEKRQKLDVYLPVSDKKPYPVLLWFHGGGWIIGDKRDGISELAGPFLRAGYAVVSANYRLSRWATFPAQINDAKAAVRWVRANAAKYHFNSDKVIAGGASAGGHLAALLGTSANVKEMEDLSLGNSGISSRVDGVIEWYAPVNFLSIDPQHLSLCQDPYHNQVNSPEWYLFGDSPREVPDNARGASPLTYISPDAPPFYIIHGKADVAIPYLQSVELEDALKKAIGRHNVRLELVEKAGHLDSALMSPEIMNNVLNFLSRF